MHRRKNQAFWLRDQLQDRIDTGSRIVLCKVPRKRFWGSDPFRHDTSRTGKLCHPNLAVIDVQAVPSQKYFDVPNDPLGIAPPVRYEVDGVNLASGIQVDRAEAHVGQASDLLLELLDQIGGEPHG
jgi:hypothetical protein